MYIRKTNNREGIMIDFYDYFFEAINNNDGLYNFVKNLLPQNKVYIFGGFVRDYLYHYNKFNDIDFVIDIKSEKLKEKLINLSDKAIIFNQFGGYKLRFDDIKVDIWTLEDTWAIKHGYYNKDELLKTVYLNVDAYAYNLSSKSFVDNCNLSDIPKFIDICFEVNPYEELNLARSIVFSRKYNIPLSSKIISKLVEVKNNEKKMQRFLNSQIKHFGDIRVALTDIDLYVR